MTRRPLGRGLDALIGSTEAPAKAPPTPSSSVSANGLMTVAPDQVVASPLQPRRHFDPERLEELSRAIQSQGIIEPLVVRPMPAADGEPSRYELVAGERRLRAARMAGLGVVPVIVRELDDNAALEMSLVENLVRDDLNAVDEARAFRRLNQEFGLSHDDIAARIGKSRPYVSNTMRLLELAPAVLEMIERGEVSAGQARPLLGLPPSGQASAARRIAEDRISARGAERIARAARRSGNGSSSSHASGQDPNVLALAEAVQRALKRKVRIVPGRGRTPGRIEIEFYDVDDLSALAVLLARSGHAPSPAS